MAAVGAVGMGLVVLAIQPCAPEKPDPPAVALDQDSGVLDTGDAEDEPEPYIILERTLHAEGVLRRDPHGVVNHYDGTTFETFTVVEDPLGRYQPGHIVCQWTWNDARLDSPSSPEEPCPDCELAYRVVHEHIAEVWQEPWACWVLAPAPAQWEDPSKADHAVGLAFDEQGEPLLLWYIQMSQISGWYEEPETEVSWDPETGALSWHKTMGPWGWRPPGDRPVQWEPAAR